MSGRRTLPWLLISRFAVVSTGWKIISSAIPAVPTQVSIYAAMRNVFWARVPAPTKRATYDSFLKSLEADLEGADGTILRCVGV